MENIRPEIAQYLTDSKYPTVTYRIFKKLKREFGLNSYETDLLLQHMTLEGLVQYADYLYSIGDVRELSRYEIPSTYSEAIAGRVLPLILRRLKD